MGRQRQAQAPARLCGFLSVLSGAFSAFGADAALFDGMTVEKGKEAKPNRLLLLF